MRIDGFGTVRAKGPTKQYLNRVVHPASGCGTRSEAGYDHTRTVKEYYDLCSEFMVLGWGESLHFAPLLPGESLLLEEDARRREIATGWSDSCRAGFAPAEKQPLSTAHEKSGLVGIGLKLLLQPTDTQVLLQTRSDPHQ